MPDGGEQNQGVKFTLVDAGLPHIMDRGENRQRRRQDKNHREKQREAIEHKAVVERAFLPAADNNRTSAAARVETDKRYRKPRRRAVRRP